MNFAPISFRSSASGSAAHARNVVTSLASCVRRGGAVVVLHAAVVEPLGHRDRAAREVRVVVKALADADARGGLAVPEEEREHVVLAVVSRLGDERKVGRVRAVVGVPGALLVGVGRGEPVAELSGAVEHLAGVVRSVGHLRRGEGWGPHFRFSAGRYFWIAVQRPRFANQEKHGCGG